jgi:hypothetical protein
VTRRTLLAAAAVALLVSGGVVAVTRLLRPPPDDAALVRAVFEDAARAAEERRAGDAVAGVSERFSGGGLDRRGVKQLVAFHTLRGEWVSVSVAGAKVRVDGDRARANVDALLLRGGAKGKPLAVLVDGEARAYRFGCRLEREPEGWKIVEATWRNLAIPEVLEGPPDPEP